MLAFRKLVPVLAALALVVGFAAQANAQAFTCSANAGVPTTVRSEGVAELVGDVLLNCTGGNNAAPFLANIQIFLNTNITSRLLTSSTSEATLLTDDNYAAPLFASRVTDNSVAWLGVPVTPPGIVPAGTTRVLRITNVRANANQAGVSSTLVPNQIVMFISASGTQSIPINNPQQVVAFVQQGLTVARRTCADDDSASTGFQQCSSSSSNLASVTSTSTSSSNRITSNLKFTERFANAFKVQGDNTQTTPGAVYSNSESGLVFSNGAGLASNATRFIARFVNIPAGIAIWVTQKDTRTGTGGTGDTLGTTSTASAILISVNDATGTLTGGFAANAAARCGSSGVNQPVVNVPLSGGAGSAVWEVLSSNPVAVESISFGVVVAYSANPASNSPAVGTGTISGNFAPISGTATMSQTAPRPRFADLPQSGTLVNISKCITTLLFPYVTNRAGFDSGIAISNTTADPFGTDAEAGTCTINYYGDTASGGTVAAATSGVVESGKQLIFTLGLGGNLGMTNAAAGFQGYLIAQCQFRYAHGFAFITNGDSAQGYLALVITSSDRSDTPESLGQ